MQIDVFNGDADGICALVQLRLAQPVHIKAGYRRKKGHSIIGTTYPFKKMIK